MTDPVLLPATRSNPWDDLLMQGISRADRDLWDAREVTGHLVAPGSVFAFLAEHRGELFPDSFTADLFPSRTGRPSLPADLVGSVLARNRVPARARSRGRARGWRFTAIPPTAAGRPAPPTAMPGTTPSSSRSRCSPPCPAGSPSTTSPSARTMARSPARPGS